MSNLVRMSNDIHLHVIFVEAWIQRGDKLLLSKRASDDEQSSGLWALPGGKVELGLGEGVIEEALRRDVREEVGLEIDDIRFFASRSFVRVSGHHVVALSFIVSSPAGEALALEDQDEVRWVTRAEAGQLLGEYFTKVL